jgi:hypothetical protein
MELTRHFYIKTPAKNKRYKVLKTHSSENRQVVGAVIASAPPIARPSFKLKLPRS